MYNKNIFEKDNKKYYKQFYAYKFNDLSRWTNSLVVGEWTTQKEIDTFNSHLSGKSTRIKVKHL